MNDVTELRTLLFDTIRAVKAGDLAVDKAKAISDLSGRVIETARVETDFLKATRSHTGTGFIPVTDAAPALPGHPPAPALPQGAVKTGNGIKVTEGNVTTHKMR